MRGPHLTADCARRLAAKVLILASLADPASAQVISIGEDGTVTRFEGPALIRSEGAEPLASKTPQSPSSVTTALERGARLAALEPAFVSAVAWAESRYRPAARSPKGALGLMQLMPETAAALRVNASDPNENAAGGARHLAALLARYGGDVRLTLAAYNAGPGAVDRYGGVPPYPETQAYVKTVVARWLATREHPRGAGEGP